MKTIVLGAIAIIILFFANLAWGSVNIPWQDVGAIISGSQTDETYRYILLESRLPAAIAALLSGCRQLCHRRFPGYPHRSLYRGYGGDGHHHLLFCHCAQPYGTAHHRTDGGLSCYQRHLIAQFLQHGRGREIVYGLGHGQLWQCFEPADDVLHPVSPHCPGCVSAPCKTAERHAVRRAVCRESGFQH